MCICRMASFITNTFRTPEGDEDVSCENIEIHLQGLCSSDEDECCDSMERRFEGFCTPDENEFESSENMDKQLEGKFNVISFKDKVIYPV